MISIVCIFLKLCPHQYSEVIPGSNIFEYFGIKMSPSSQPCYPTVTFQEVHRFPFSAKQISLPLKAADAHIFFLICCFAPCQRRFSWANPVQYIKTNYLCSHYALCHLVFKQHFPPSPLEAAEQ